VGLPKDLSLIPLGIGSGCIIKSGNRRVLVGAGHVIERAPTDWAVHLSNDSQTGAQFYFLRPTFIREPLEARDLWEFLDFFGGVGKHGDVSHDHIQKLFTPSGDEYWPDSPVSYESLSWNSFGAIS